jgi:CBS domain-containing protein
VGATIATVIAHKGATVITVRPWALVAEAAAAMTEHRIGALVVSRDGAHVDGIISERDIVHGCAQHGADALQRPVTELMSAQVHTCPPTATIDELATTMTTQRFRHVPVVEDDRLIAIVSIGDIVKAKIDALVDETDQLHAYVAGSY